MSEWVPKSAFDGEVALSRERSQRAAELEGELRFLILAVEMHLSGQDYMQLQYALKKAKEALQ